MKRNTIRDLQKLCDDSIPITMVTCYDYTFARLVDRSNIDIILVGDSLGNVIQGHPTTLPVTVDDVIYHTRAVIRGTERVHVVADLPFLAYEISIEEGLRSAGRLMKEGFAQSVKLEGGAAVVPLVKRLTEAGIPVCGHLGLTPQSVHALGGFRVQGRDATAAQRLIDDALALQDAGAYMIVLELIPEALGKSVSDALTIPTIGIGAGVHTDGQVLVLQDLLGLNPDFKPKFVKKFSNLAEQTVDALNSYSNEVKSRSFPNETFSFN